MLSSVFLRNRIVTNQEEAVTTVAGVTKRQQIRNYTCWPDSYFVFIVSPHFYIELMFYYNIRRRK